MTSYTCITTQLSGPALVLHGGAGAYLQATTKEARALRGQFMLQAALGAANRLTQPGGARQAVLEAVGQMELDPRFNAGMGCKLQRDGLPRVSAALMDGLQQRHAAVINVENCLHPSRLAEALLPRGDRTLDNQGAQRLMRELGIEPTDLRTERTLERWRSLLASGDTTDPESAFGDTGRPNLELARGAQLPVPEDLAPLRAALPPEDQRYGTVGAVAVDSAGQIYACTSTGGRGHETPGRVSDSATPAGNYACPAVALSATGFGEQILDLNVCGRIATRMLDGASLEDALRRTFDEVARHGGLLGVIAITPQGQVGYAHTTEACGVAWCGLQGQQHLDPHSR